MARVHLQAGYDVVAPQFGVGQDFFEAIDAMVGETSAACHEIVLTGHPERVASQFRQRRAERTLAGENDVSTNISDDRIDEVIARATKELTALAAARPHTTVISTDGDVDSTYVRVREVLQRRGGWLFASRCELAAVVADPWPKTTQNGWPTGSRSTWNPVSRGTGTRNGDPVAPAQRSSSPKTAR